MRVEEAKSTTYRYNPRVSRMFLVQAVTVCVLVLTACASGHPSAALVVRHDQIRLVPDIEAGEVGWCAVTLKGFTCPDGSTEAPIISESWTRSSPPPITQGYVVTTNQVRAVSINGGHPIATRSESTLPNEFRVVAVEVRDRHGALGSNPRTIRPNVRLFDGRGRLISERRIRVGLFRLPTAVVPDPDHPTHGACRIEDQPVPIVGLVADEANVATQVIPDKDPLGKAFMSCANTKYHLGGQRLAAAVLLDASHPGLAPPRLPAMRPLAGSTAIVEAPGLEGEMAARRVSGGWLVVEGGNSVGQRVAVVRHLRASIHL